MRGSAGFTRLEYLGIVVLLAFLSLVVIPAYGQVIDRAREVHLRGVLYHVPRLEAAYQLLDPDHGAFSGDFAELRELGAPFRNVTPEPATREPNDTGGFLVRSRCTQNGYHLELQAEYGNRGTRWSLTAIPTRRPEKRRWFYVDDSGVIRSGIGSADASSTPVS